MAGNKVGSATISLEADTAAFSQGVQAAIDNLLKQIAAFEKSLSTSMKDGTKKAGDEVEKNLSESAKNAGKKVEENLTEAAKKADKALGQIDADGLKKIPEAAAQAGKEVADSITKGAAQASHSLGQVDSSGLSSVSRTAAQVGEQVSTNLGAGLRGVGRQAESSASMASSALSSISSAASRVAETTSSAFSGLGQRISNSISSAHSTAAGVGSKIQEYLDQNFRKSEASALRIPPAVGQIGLALAAAMGPAKMLKGGFDRLMNIQRAEIGFKNIGLTAEQTKTQMAKLSEQVTGTSVSLSDAAKYSAMFAQSGVQMGKPMDDTIKAFTNLAAAAQGTGTDVGVVLQQISAAGRLMGGDAMQLQQAGINIYNYVAKYMGKSVDEVKKLGEQGKITFEDVVGAINAGMGDYAKEMGETLPAKLSNFNTALSNLGAAIIEPFIPGITAAVEFGTSVIKWLVKPVKEVTKLFGDMGLAGEVLKNVLVGVGTAVSALSFVWVITQIGLVQSAVASAVAAIGPTIAFLTSPISLVIIAIAGLVAGFVTLWNKSEAFRNFWKGLWEQITEPVRAAIDKVKILWDGLTGLFRNGEADTGSGLLVAAILGPDLAAKIIPIIGNIKTAFGELVTAFQGGDDGYGALSRIVGDTYAERIVNAIGWVGDTLRSLGDFARGVWDILYKGDYTGLPFGLEEDSLAVELLFWIRDAALSVWEGIKKLWDAFSNLGQALAQAGLDVVISVFSALWEVLKSVWGAVVDLGKALAPILLPALKIIGAVIGGVLIAAVVLLIGALKVLAGIFEVVATAISWLVENIVGPLISAIGSVVSWLVDKLGSAISWFFNFLGDAFIWVRDIVSGVWDFLQSAWESVGKPVVDFIVDAFLVGFGLIVLGVQALQPVWDWCWTHLQEAWEAYGQPVVSWIGDRFNDLWAGVQAVLNWIKDLWADIWAGIQVIYQTYIAPVVGWIVERFQIMKTGVQYALDVVREKLNSTGDRVVGFYNDYVAPMVNWVRDKLAQMGDFFRQVKDKIVGALSDAGQWLFDIGHRIVDGLIQGVKAKFAAIRDTMVNLASEAKAAAKSALGIHSPSRVFQELGTYVGEGFALGIEGMQGRVASAADSIASAADLPSIPTSLPTAPQPGVAAPTAASTSASTPSTPEGPDTTGFAQMAADMSMTADSVLNPMWAQQQLMMASFGANAVVQTQQVVLPAWQAMASGLSSVASSVISPTMGSVQNATVAMAAQFPAQVNGVVSPALAAMGSALWNVKATGVDPVFAGIQGGLNTVVGAFATGVNAITAQWGRVREATAAPVRFTIQSVFNDGLVGMWNSVAELLGVTRMGTYPVRFATGGYVSGPGGPTADKIPALLSDGEYVMKASAVERIGVRNLNALNDGSVSVAPGVLGSRRQVNEMLRDRTFNEIASRFSAGGIVEGSPAWNALKRAHIFARKWSPLPYIWGGSLGANGGTDCSGWVSSIADVILGGSGMLRQWATMSFPGPQQGAWAPGLAYGFSVGISDPHTAGTLSGVAGFPTVNVESGGNTGQGPTYGGRATGADDPQFPRKWHLRIVDGGRFVPGAGSGVSMADMVSGAMNPYKEKIRNALAGMPKTGGIIDKLPLAVAEKLQTAAQKKIDKLIEELDQDPGGGGVERWAPLVKWLLNRYGHPQSWLGSTLRRMQQESGGNPRAINNWDVNAKNGDPSKGLMQVIGSTFAAYRDPAFPNDIWNPKANVAASMRYAMARYGSLPAAYDRPGGYHNGGVLGAGQGLFHKTAFAPERVLSPRQTESFESLVEWLRETPKPSLLGTQGTQGAYGSGVTRQVLVTQNIISDDSKDAADQVEDRLMSLIV